MVRKRKEQNIPIGSNKPLLLLGIRNILLIDENERDRLIDTECPQDILQLMEIKEEKEDRRCKYINVELLSFIKDLFDKGNVEIKWLTDWIEMINIIEKVLKLPSFESCNNLSNLTNEDLKRPLILLDDKNLFFKTNSKVFKNRFYGHSFGKVVINRINVFLEQISLKTIKFKVIFVPLKDGNIENINLLSDNAFSSCQRHETEPRKSLMVKMQNPEKYLTWNALKTYLIEHPGINPYIRHLKKHPEAIYLHYLNSWGEVPGNNIVNGLKESNNTVLLVYPPIINLIPPNLNLEISLIRRPLILLDVDGVINPINYSHNEFKAEYPDMKESKCSSFFDVWPIAWSPYMISCINTWSKTCEIRWLTSWENNARYRLAPLIGLLDFEVCKFNKIGVLYENMHNKEDLERPFIWIDDMSTSIRLKYIVKNEVLLVAPKVFLTIKEIKMIDEFIKKCITSPSTLEVV